MSKSATEAAATQHPAGTDLPNVVLAMQPLNQHARAYGDGKRAIYAYKALIAGYLAALKLADVRLVRWTGQCSHCSGTGRYVDSYGERWPHCRRCSSTGIVELRFVETTVADGIVWHHPFEYSHGGSYIAAIAGAAKWRGDRPPYGYYDGDGNEAIFWNVTDGWKPNQPAARLDAESAARELNIVEPFILSRPFDEHPDLRWLLSPACDEMRRYRLDLGRSGDVCTYCGSTERVHGLGATNATFVQWSRPICSECSARRKPLIFPHASELPARMVTPAIAEWLERHLMLGFDNQPDRWF